MSISLPPPDAAARRSVLDPARSFIVQAPAGSGKTTLLSQRYLSLLGVVNKPEEVLAITFTKKAAAEMRSRVLDLLAGDSALAANVRQRDLRLGWNLAQNPNQLKIQTIDSFAYEVASQALGASNTRGLNLVEDASGLFELAAERLLGRLYSDDPLSEFIADFLAFLDNDASQAIRLVSHMLAKRDQWWHAATRLMAAAQDSESVRRLMTDSIIELRAKVTAPVTSSLTATDWEMIRRLAQVIDTEATLADTVPFLFTRSGQLRKRITAREHIAFGESGLRRQFAQWLDALRDRGLQAPLATLLKLPPQAMHPAQERMLTVCCTCLAIAAVELDQLFQERQTLDFTGLILRAQQGLRDADAPTDLALQWDYRINHILVDEFQDTSHSQYHLFRLITEGWDASDGRTFFAVGDPMQSIYRFRDADVSIFVGCHDRGLEQIPLDPVRLDANFRSAPVLVDWCNGLFAKIFGSSNHATVGAVEHAPAIATRSATDGARAVCYRFDSPDAQVHTIVAEIAALVESGETIGILCRARKHLDQLILALRARNITWQAQDIDPLNQEPVILDLMALHAVVVSPDDRLAWFTVLRSPVVGLQLVELDQLQDVRDIPGYLSRLTPASPPLQRLTRAYAWATSRLFEAPLREVVEGFWFRLGGVDAYDDRALEHAVFWFELLEDLHDSAYAPGAVKRAVDGLYANPPANDSRVQIMTIHKSKGLEFDHVFVPFLDRRTQSDDPALLLWDPASEGLLMGIKDDPVHDWLTFQNQSRDENENKRLLYVAFTRARKSLFVSYVSSGEREPAGLAKYVAHVAQDATQCGLSRSEAATARDPRQVDLFEHRSFRALPTDYAWRPPAYRPLAPASSAIDSSDPIAARFEVNLGNLVHRALAWLAGGADRESGRVKDLVAAWARASNVTEDDEERLAESAAAQVARVLADPVGRWILDSHHEHASELPLTGMIDDEIVHIVLDRTFVEHGVRWVIDFKTGAPTQASEQAFLHAESTRYAPQLERYRRITRAVFPEPIQVALYFTALAALHVLPE